MEMAKEVRCSKASDAQKEYLINYLENHTDFANDRYVSVNGVKCAEEKWTVLGNELNAIGGTCKDGAKWKKYWRDLRQHTRTKYLNLKEALNQTGTGRVGQKPLSELEERIISITTKEAVDGDAAPESELGFSEVPPCVIEEEVLLQSEPSTSGKRRKRRQAEEPKENIQNELLEIEREKLRLKKKKIALMESNNQILLEIKNIMELYTARF